MKLSHTILIFLYAVSIVNCQLSIESEKHVFYLHGRIIELQGINAVSDQFGKYRFNEIIDSLKSIGTVVHYEVRTAETDFYDFCSRTSNQIDSLIQSGVAAKDISVIGASKGAVMAMNISSINKNPINYILLAANNDYIEAENDWNLHGRVLGIYERSDLLAGKDYSYWIEVSTNAETFEQLEINTGLGHGFLYRPLKDWLAPAKDWINKIPE